MSDLLSWLRNRSEMRNLGQNVMDVLNRGVVAGAVGGPVDLATLGVNALIAGTGYAGNKLGLVPDGKLPELISKPVGGSEWVAEKMRGGGLLGNYRNPTAETIAGGLLAPAAGAAISQRAPQIARGLLQMGDNIAAPSDIARQGQRGMALFDPSTSGAEIKSKAESLASAMREKGWSVDLQHSGSAAGASSYITASDPLTGRVIKDLRLSAHSKGPWNSQFSHNINADDFADVLRRLDELRAQGPTEGFMQLNARASEAAAKAQARLERLIQSARQKMADGVQLSSAERSALRRAGD